MNVDVCIKLKYRYDNNKYRRKSKHRVQGVVERQIPSVDMRLCQCAGRYQYPVRVVGNTENFHETTLVGHEKGMKRARKGHEKILEFIKNNPQISILALAKEFGITVKAMRLTLDKLKAEKRISRIGPNKGGYWQVMDIAVTE